MRLIDLEPRWLAPDLFVFRCPCCRGTPRAVWLSCKSRPIPSDEQREAFVSAGLEEEDAAVVVGSRESVAWSIEGAPDFGALTVKPSIDASAAGHWHGFITAGEIR